MITMPGRTLTIVAALGLTLASGTARSAPQVARPTGPWSVGTRTFDWVDASRAEPASEDPEDHRAIVVQIWYPADADPAPAPAPYMPRLDAYRQHPDQLDPRRAGLHG